MTVKNQIFTQFYYVSVKKNYVINAKLCHAIQNEEENDSFFLSCKHQAPQLKHGLMLVMREFLFTLNESTSWTENMSGSSIMKLNIIGTYMKHS